MASAEFSRRIGKVVGYLPLVEMSGDQRLEFQEALLEADAFEALLDMRPRAKHPISPDPPQRRP